MQERGRRGVCQVRELRLTEFSLRLWLKNSKHTSASELCWHCPSRGAGEKSQLGRFLGRGSTAHPPTRRAKWRARLLLARADLARHVARTKKPDQKGVKGLSMMALCAPILLCATMGPETPTHTRGAMGLVIMPEKSYGGENSTTTAIPHRPSAATSPTILSASRGMKPPGSGQPVPGTKPANGTAQHPARSMRVRRSQRRAVAHLRCHRRAGRRHSQARRAVHAPTFVPQCGVVCHWGFQKEFLSWHSRFLARGRSPLGEVNKKRVCFLMEHQNQGQKHSKLQHERTKTLRVQGRFIPSRDPAQCEKQNYGDREIRTKEKWRTSRRSACELGIVTASRTYPARSVGRRSGRPTSPAGRCS